MLDVAKVIRPSNDGRFDTVVFFDRTAEAVAETQKNIPGSIGFPGDFTTVVLLDDPEEDTVVDTEEELKGEREDSNTAETHRRQMLITQRRRFIQLFPFDIVNLDLEEFLLKPNDPLPGKVVNALRKLLSWQRRSIPGDKGRRIDSFVFMFTTQIGPPNLNEQYLQMLEQYLVQNITTDPELRNLLRQRIGDEAPAELRTRNFAEFFKLAMPKVLAASLRTEDWFIDPEKGIRIYEFGRESREGPYSMLHLVMEVRRQEPPADRRAPGQEGRGVAEAYEAVVRQLFRQGATLVSEASIPRATLERDLERIFSRRKKYLGG
jgi:hypothetical protein